MKLREGMSRKLILLIISSFQPSKWKVLVLIAIILLFLGSAFLVTLKSNRGKFDLNASVNYSFVKTRFKSNLVLTEKPSCKFSLNSQCSISCYSTTISDIVAISTYEPCGNATVFLTLRNVLFDNKTIAEGWLKEFPKNVTKLMIDSNNLYYLGNRSFAGDPFRYLDSLTLTNTNIVYLEKSNFEGMNVSILEFRCDDYREIKFEYGALEPLGYNLSSLQINNYELKPQGLVNLTGSTNLRKLLTLDLRYNKISGIDDKAFSGIKFVQQLYLTSSHVKHIAKHSLAGLNDLVTFCIEGNELTTLQNGSFDNFQNNGQTRLITMSNNPWNCNCDLQWLKDFYTKTIATNFRNIPLQCKVGNNWKYYYEIDFCPSSTTIESTTVTSTTNSITTTMEPVSSTTRDTTPQYSTTPRHLSTSTEHTTSNVPNYPTTTSSTDITTKYSTLSTSSIANITTTYSTISTTPSNGKNNISLLCRDNSQNPPIDMRLSRSYSHSVLVRNGTITYDFYKIVGTPNYDIFLENSEDADYLIYINVNDHDDIGCIFNIQNKVSLSRLKYSEHYILCLLNENKVEVSPFDCTSLQVPPSWGDMPWMFNKDKTLVIILLTIAFLLTVIITATVIYTTLRKNPKLIKAFRKFVVRENTFQDKEYGRLTPLSFYSTSDGYLTPKFSIRRNYQLDTISEKDFIGGINTCTDSKWSKVDEQTPPRLPPNHPNLIIASDENITPFIPIA